MIFAPLSAAYRMPRATSSSMPPTSVAEPNSTSQSLASTFTGISLTLKATPAVPMPSFVSWPIVPLTCVPWPSKSSGGRRLVQTKSCGATMRPALAGADELRRGRIRNRDRAERRIADALIVRERGNRRGDRRVLVRHAGVDHRDGDRRSGLRLDVPGLLHVDASAGSTAASSTADRWARTSACTRCGDLRVLHLGPLAEQRAPPPRRLPTGRCARRRSPRTTGARPISAGAAGARGPRRGAQAPTPRRGISRGRGPAR